jgi:hypothetical protein
VSVFQTRATKNLPLIHSVPPRSLFYLFFLSPLSSPRLSKARSLLLDSGGSNGARERTYGFFCTGCVVPKNGRAHGAGPYDSQLRSQFSRSLKHSRKVRFINPKSLAIPSVSRVRVNIRRSVNFLPSILSFFWAQQRGRSRARRRVRQPSLSDRPIVVQCCTPSLDPLVTIRCLWPKERVVAPPQAERTAHRSSSSSLSSLSSSSASSLILSLSFDELLGLTPNAVTYHRFIGSLESGTNVLTTH